MATIGRKRRRVEDDDETRQDAKVLKTHDRRETHRRQCWERRDTQRIIARPRTRRMRGGASAAAPTGIFRLHPSPHSPELMTDIDVHQRTVDISGQRVAARLKRSREKRMNCKTCLGIYGRCSVKNLPCGHVTNCQDCCPHMKICNLCEGRITGTEPIEEEETALQFIPHLIRMAANK